MEMPGIEPGASRMLSARSTTELHPLIFNVVTSVMYMCFFFTSDLLHIAAKFN